MPYDTMNPVPSTDPRDLYDDAGIIDKYATSDAPFVPDRLGVLRRTWKGMEVDFTNAQEGRQAQFETQIGSMGYTWVADYGPGLLFTSRNQYMVRDGVPYAVANSTTLPYTTTGNWATEVSKFKAISADDILRADLADPDDGANLIAYKQPLAAAVARTLMGKITEVVSLFDFGAVADGDYNAGTGTNNTPMVQAAIDSLVPNGGTALYIPPGMFRLASPVSVPSGVTIIGAGMWSSLFFCAAAFGDLAGLIKINGTGGYPTCITGIGVITQNGGAGGSGIVSTKNGVFLDQIWVNGFTGGYGIRLSSTDNFLNNFASEICAVGVGVTESHVNVTHGTVFSCPQGLLVGNNASGETGRVTVTSVRATQCGQSGFVISSGKNVTLSACGAAHPNDGQFVNGGVIIESSSSVIVQGFSGSLGGTPTNVGTGIKATNSTDIIIVGCETKGFRDGIVSNGCNRITISDSQARGNSRRGIWLSGGDRVMASSNIAMANGTAGSSTDAGILSENTSGFALHSLIGNTCTQDGGGVQDYGINATVTDNGAISGFTNISSNTCRYNSVSNITVGGKANNIILNANLPIGAIGQQSVVSVGSATYTASQSEKSIVTTFAGTVTLTLPAAIENAGRQITVKTTTANTVVSATSNVVPLIGGSAGTAILAATIGKFAVLESNGTSWVIMNSN